MRRIPFPELAVAAFFAVFLVWPIADVLIGAFAPDGKPSLDGFRLAFSDPTFTRSLTNSLFVASMVTVITTLLAFPLATLFVHRRFPCKGLFQGALLAALVLPPFVAAIGMRQLFARFGSVNLLLLDLGWIERPIDFLGRWPLAGVIVMEVLHLFPVLFLNLAASLAAIDPSLDEAAVAVGASPARRFFRITLPLALPGWFAGAIIVFIFALTDLGSPIVFEARDLVPIQILERATEGRRDATTQALVVIVLAIALVLFLASRRIVGSRINADASKGATRGLLRPLSRTGTPFVIGALVVLVLLTLLPHLSIVLVAISDRWFFTPLPERFTLDHFAQVASDEIAWLGVKNSLLYAGMSTLLDVVLGVTIASAAVRRGGRLARFLDAFAMAPLALPGVVLAFGLATTFSSGPLRGSVLDPMRDPTILIVLGYAVRRLPYVVRATDAGFRQVPIAFEEAAQNLGARARTTFRRVTLPLIAGNLLAGAILAFSFAMLEVSESLILAQTKDHYPIAKAIYQLLGDLSRGPQIASAMGVIGMLVLGYALIVAARLLGKGLAQVFRA